VIEFWTTDPRDDLSDRDRAYISIWYGN